METRASPFVVGLFTLAVLAGVLVFVFWLGRYGEHAGRETYQVVFSDEVTGLSRGSSVLYNGIRVGEVTNLSISPADLTQVVATIQVDANVPMRADTRAQLQFQGITGIGLVQLRGGTADAPALREVWDQPGPPLIEADRSQFQNLMDGAQSLLARLDSVADQVETLISANEDSLSTTVRNVETFTTALAENSDDIGTFLSDAGAAARRLDSVGARLETLSENLDTVVTAVDPDAVRGIVSDVQSFASRLDAASGQLAALVADNEEALANTIRNAETFSAALAENSEAISGFMADAGAAARRFDSAGERIESLAGRADEILAAVEPETVRTILADAESFTARLDETSRQLAALIADNEASLTSTIRNAETFSAALAENSEAISGFMADAGAAARRLDSAGERIESLAGRADEILGAIEPETVRTILADAESFTGRLNETSRRFAGLIADNEAALTNTISNAETFSATLAENSEVLSSFLADAASAAQRLDAAGGRIEELAARADEVVSAVEPEAVREIVSDARAFSRMLADNSEQIGNLAQDAGSAAERLNRLAGDLEGVGENVARVVSAVDPERVARSVENVESFTSALAERSDDFERFMEDAGVVAAQLRQSTARLDDLFDRVDGMMGEEGDGFISEIAAAARAFRQLSENLDERLAAITGDIQRLGGGGMREFQAFMSEGRRTLTNIERVITNLERDPSRLLFGGSRSPEYNPGRRF